MYPLPSQSSTSSILLLNPSYALRVPKNTSRLFFRIAPSSIPSYIQRICESTERGTTGRLSGQFINESTNQRINESTNLRINESANLRICESANLRINESANQRINESTNQRINESANLRICESANLRICESANPAHPPKACADMM